MSKDARILEHSDACVGVCVCVILRCISVRRICVPIYDNIHTKKMKKKKHIVEKYLDCLETRGCNSESQETGWLDSSCCVVQDTRSVDSSCLFVCLFLVCVFVLKILLHQTCKHHE